jgi:hypothetical protein
MARGRPLRASIGADAPDFAVKPIGDGRDGAGRDDRGLRMAVFDLLFPAPIGLDVLDFAVEPVDDGRDGGGRDGGRGMAVFEGFLPGAVVRRDAGAEGFDAASFDDKALDDEAFVAGDFDDEDFVAGAFFLSVQSSKGGEGGGHLKELSISSSSDCDTLDVADRGDDDSV